MVTFPMTLTDP